MQLTTFVGRRREIDEVTRCLGESRLLTLAGPGGIGKTRLALEIVAHLGAAASVVELAGVTDDDRVAAAVRTAALVAPEDRDRARGLDDVSAVAAHLAGASALIVLDSCEHVVAGAAATAAALLAAAPGLRVLATSREPLAVPGEVVWRVPTLDVDDASSLFTDRANRMRPDAPPHPPAAVARLCRMLDQLPLAIELAAARTAALSVEEITARLEDRLSLLAGRARTIPTRQQTMRAAIDWSHALLDDDERLLFRRMAVFRGGFSLGAVESVCAGRGLEASNVLDVLGRLVEKSLVVATLDDAAAARYHLLESIRHYALEKIVEVAPPEPSAMPVTSDGDTWTMGREGDVWAIGAGEVSLRLRHAKGFEYLATLLREPGREWAALDLAGAGVDTGDSGETIDDTAKRAYRDRISALDEEIDEARSWNDDERAARAEEEREFIIGELARDLGLGGRARRATSASERARSAVTQAIRSTIRRILQEHPEVGRHLERSVRTGTRCSYDPGPDETVRLRLTP